MRPVCLITGASGRLGTALCRALIRDHDIFAVYRRTLPSLATDEDELIDPLNLEGTSPVEGRSPIFAASAELDNAADLDRVVELAAARFGRIDVLVNAAVHRRWAGMIESAALASDAALQFEVNVLVPFRLAVAIARRFWRDRPMENRQEHRNVINISSIAGRVLYPNRGQSIYAASKSALDTLTRHMASEFAAFGVRVNAVAPNSFPEIVPTSTVIDGVLELKRGSLTGEVLVIDRSRDGRVVRYFDKGAGTEPPSATSIGQSDKRRRIG